MILHNHVVHNIDCYRMMTRTVGWPPNSRGRVALEIWGREQNEALKPLCFLFGILSAMESLVRLESDACLGAVECDDPFVGLLMVSLLVHISTLLAHLGKVLL